MTHNHEPGAGTDPTQPYQQAEISPGLISVVDHFEGSSKVMAKEYTTRPAQLEDVAFLWRMLREAAYWHSGLRRPSESEMLADDHFVRYVCGWGRFGDVGIIAEDSSGQPLGAAWFRLHSDERPGYGFIDGATPEVSIAVREDRRGHGIGTALLRDLLQEAAAAGFSELSLSVSAENPALNLYKRLGFVEVEVFGDSWTMRISLTHSN